MEDMPADSHGDRQKDLPLINRVKSIFERSDFLTDRAVKILTTTSSETDLDVCAWHQEVLVITYCTTAANVKFQNLVDKWCHWRDEIVREKGTLTIKTSLDGRFTATVLDKTTRVKMVIALDNCAPNEEMMKYAADREVQVLNGPALDYYGHIVKALGKWTKYAVFKDFEIEREEEGGSVPRPAIMVRQPGIGNNQEMYIFTLAPHQLLPISYVFRRSFKPEFAYQRMIRERRIEEIGRFLAGRALIPNAILIAFDDEIASEVIFTKSASNPLEGILQIPKKYCSAWIVDGQHRLYGFTRTKFSEPPPDSPQPQEKFDLIVVGLKNIGRESQAKSFIDINYNQVGIDPTLLCDLLSLTKDLKHYLTWPSLVVKSLSSRDPWKNKIRVLEIEKDRPITLAGFAKFALAVELLKNHVDKTTGEIHYVGPLYTYAKFDVNKSVDDPSNVKSLQKQVNLLSHYFTLVRQHLEDARPGAWDDSKKYGVTKSVAVNALLLVLTQILGSSKEDREKILSDLEKYLKPVASLSFTSSMIAKYGTGWQAFRGLANRIIDVLNQHNKIKLAHLSGGKKK
jgi:DGQHR domain-containing protein